MALSVLWPPNGDSRLKSCQTAKKLFPNSREAMEVYKDHYKKRS
jgi:hypothetical protein